MVTERPNHRLHRAVCAAGEAQPRWAGVSTESRIETGMCGDLDETGRASGSLHGEVRFATGLQGGPKSRVLWRARFERWSWQPRGGPGVRGAAQGSQRTRRKGQVAENWFHPGAARCQSGFEVRPRLRPSVFPPNQIARAGGWRRRSAQEACAPSKLGASCRVEVPAR